ncbi:MAG: class I SAM-dependent methyltransferase [Verrucomicrobiia bacterium]|jgi:predicted O-methyltransferase YrrM
MKQLRFLCDYVLGGVGVLYLFTIGVLRARHRIFIQNLVSHLGLRRDKVATRPLSILPTIHVNSLLTSEQSVCLTEAEEVYGNVSTLELALINSFVRRLGPKAIFEIGTFDGRTTLNMAANAPTDCRLFTLDLPADQTETAALRLDEWDRHYILKSESGSRFKGHPLSQRIVQLLGDSATFNYTPFLGQMDMVFVDGSHSYEYVLSDSRIAFQLLRRCGIIIWHDYGCDCLGVTLALNELFASGGEFKALRHIRGTRLAYLERRPETTCPPPVGGGIFPVATTKTRNTRSLWPESSR